MIKHGAGNRDNVETLGQIGLEREKITLNQSGFENKIFENMTEERAHSTWALSGDGRIAEGMGIGRRALKDTAQ